MRPCDEWNQESGYYSTGCVETNGLCPFLILPDITRIFNHLIDDWNDLSRSADSSFELCMQLKIFWYRQKQLFNDEERIFYVMAWAG